MNEDSSVAVLPFVACTLKKGSLHQIELEAGDDDDDNDDDDDDDDDNDGGYDDDDNVDDNNNENSHSLY